MRGFFKKTETLKGAIKANLEATQDLTKVIEELRKQKLNGHYGQGHHGIVSEDGQEKIVWIPSRSR